MNDTTSENNAPGLRLGTNGKHWDDMVALPPVPAAHAYVLCHSTGDARKAHFIWKGNNGEFYSPPFDDSLKALKFPEENLFRLHPKEEIESLLSLRGLA